MGYDIMKRENSRLLTTDEINMGLSLIELILDGEKITNVFQLYEKTMECNWSKISKLVLSKCLFETDIKGNIINFHKVSQEDDLLIHNVDDCEYARARCGNTYIIVHL